ncbi:dihydroorotate dehydrogenase electron transfer subunit [Clostridium sp. YIM B02515]|uniref:Dihydroorotate dehydrogenase B (NAD(+)), electron transfer subunit n=1 Tax=Clostridium rhizosphaerae TaxID=2803861 RepID=A0ABS1T5T7_9CLOT|nr:dihydroorotate dehydrogenase electron transfer subunit [Clostridium rhizosphaerae]MBL4934690.1 dihydroorotate dehydrogenase electron transfer subunit [Clostridium rhizosphaerae]
MNLNYLSAKVLSNKEIKSGIYRLHIEGNYKAKPGQFFMLSAWEGQTLLPRPISIEDIDDKGIYFLYQVKGKGTKILSRLNEGENIKLLGPLGNGFDTECIKGRVAIVAGGIGIAPMKYLVKNLSSSADIYCGFRDEVYGIDSMEEYIGKVYISTDDGSHGHKGFITDIFEADKYDTVICCGPEVMMNKVVKKCREASVSVYVSTEKYMACGLGACLVCTCNTIKGNKRACTDGPVFLGEELILDA